jgi:hypothetical protein
MKMRTLLTAVVAALLASATAIAVLATPSPATANPAAPARPAAAPCSQDQSDYGGGTHLGVTCPDDDQNTGDDNDGGDEGGPGGSAPQVDPDEACAGLDHWIDCREYVATNNRHPDDMCGYVVAPDQSQLYELHPDAPADATLMVWICPTGDMYAYQYVEDDTMWVVGDPAVALPPSPAEVAQGLWTQVQADLHNPTLDASPPEGSATAVNTAVFVAVDNWQGTQTDQACEQGVCVVLTATPRLTFDPGDGSDVVACEPGGTRYDEAGAEPKDQAARAGACAHVYERFTGRGDRPDEWPGVVSVHWEAHWEQQGGGQEGDFDPVVLSADLPRAVSEHPSVVTDISPDGG